MRDGQFLLLVGHPTICHRGEVDKRQEEREPIYCTRKTSKGRRDPLLTGIMVFLFRNIVCVVLIF